MTRVSRVSGQSVSESTTDPVETEGEGTVAEDAVFVTEADNPTLKTDLKESEGYVNDTYWLPDGTKSTDAGPSVRTGPDELVIGGPVEGDVPRKQGNIYPTAVTGTMDTSGTS